MDRIPTHELLIRLLEHEYSNGYESVLSFAKKVRLNRQTIQDLLNRRVSYVKTDSLDIVLKSFGLSLSELEAKYGEIYKYDQQ